TSCQVDNSNVKLKPVVHRVTTINGIEQSRQKSNLYRRKPAEAVSRILRKNYSTTYMMEEMPTNVGAF
ncbi:CRISPR-associated RAMP protein, Csm5 family, partial [Trichinella spiralis]|uniref:CRISPR-associated RAMP protein, Csm5 family n=1 Tax=Trichinella spiralis TaxID=6334 RepID=UPI0001EFD20B